MIRTAVRPVVEVAPLKPRQWSMFENQSHLKTVEEKRREHSEEDGRTHVEWPPLRKTGRRLISPKPEMQAALAPTAKGSGKGHRKGKEQDS